MASVLDFEKEIDGIFDKEQSDFKELKKEYLSALITTLENYEKISKNLENKDYEKIDLNIKDFLKKIKGIKNVCIIRVNSWTFGFWTIIIFLSCIYFYYNTN